MQMGSKSSKKTRDVFLWPIWVLLKRETKHRPFSADILVKQRLCSPKKRFHVAQQEQI